ncbi:MAG: T9SS type A sorting domain-containing protein, partial [Bacteroidales bacterium]|nr:T9SS type A sorting domain-containing protein [Bacteroidales bacterium]
MMKFNYLLLLSFVLTSSFAFSNAEADSVSMGEGYANDVFYSLENGVVATAERANWDIGFYTTKWSAGIIINGGTGTKLVTYQNGDTTSWNAIDTTGMASWKQLNNSDTLWEEGAFNRNALGHPDYGWGVYNMVTHDVVGDSIYIITLANGAKKKLWIKRKNSTNNTYTFLFTDLFSNREHREVLDVTPYEDKMFVYYNLSTRTLIDREPVRNSWDLLFSRYTATVYDTEGNPSPYIVVGVLSNEGVLANKHYPVGDNYRDWSSKLLEDVKTQIGHDWKYFDMDTFGYGIEDSTVYFVQNLKGDVYKFVPTYFSGTSEGKTVFTKELISLVSVDERLTTDDDMSIIPNPATNQIRIAVNALSTSLAEVHIYDLTGKEVFNTKKPIAEGQLELELDNFQSGLY